MRNILVTLLLLLSVLLVGCSKKIESVSDEYLKEKMLDCRTTREPAPALIFACENYEKECERRRKERKRNVC
jgi:hypothetical protein